MQYVLAVAFTIAVWWLSTMVLMRRVAMPRATYRTTLAWATLVLACGVAAIVMSRGMTGPPGAYVAFLGALAVWAWHETSYLLGFVNGPRPHPCPPNASGWRRFLFGLKACLYHELAIVATAAVFAVLLWDASNQVALWTFLILGLMRWSAKLNIFLGVRNLHSEFWPDHLRYLQSFVRERPMNALFPLSIAGALVGLAFLWSVALAAQTGSGEQAGAILLAALLSLAVLEHGFLMLRVPDDALWRIGMRTQR